MVVSPEPITPEKWLPIVWGDDTAGVSPFEDPLDEQWFRDALVAGVYRHNALVELLVGGTTRHLLGHADLPLFLAH